MTSEQGFIEFIVEQCQAAGTITYRKMFGDYAIYVNGKVTALVCDNQVFVKPSQAGRVFIGEVQEAPPYPGAKDYFLIEDRFEDSEWFSQLMRITADELPQPQPKTRKKTGAPKGTL